MKYYCFDLHEPVYLCIIMHTEDRVTFQRENAAALYTYIREAVLKSLYFNRVFADMHLKQYLMACFMLALLLETILEQSFSRIKYLDEVTVLITGIVFLFFVIKERRVNNDELAILLLTVCMCGLGFAGNAARWSC